MENRKKQPLVQFRKDWTLSRKENIPLDELFRLFLTNCKLKNLADVTIQGYTTAYKYFVAWLGRNVTCEDITQDLMNEYVLYSLHLFRHTFITESVKSGMPIVFLKRITGHSSFTQLNRYYQYNPTDLVDVVDEYNPLETLTIKRKVF